MSWENAIERNVVFLLSLGKWPRVFFIVEPILTQNLICLTPTVTNWALSKTFQRIINILSLCPTTLDCNCPDFQLWISIVWSSSRPIDASISPSQLKSIAEIPRVCDPYKKYILVQYTIANPNRGVPIRKISVPITEFVRISEVALIVWKINNTKICDNPLLLV